MKNIRIALVILALLAGSAKAHKDRVLHLEADGSIPEIPAVFGPVRLVISGLGTVTPLVQLTIGRNQTTLPTCVARMIRTTEPGGIRLSGSWYHDESLGGPYYLGIQFPDPSFDPKWSINSSYEFLFNLHNADLISAHAVHADLVSRRVEFSALQLPSACTLTVKR